MQVIKTVSDHNHDVELAGVGVAGKNGKGGVRLDLAARSMPELQEKDEFGHPKLVNGAPVPLEGSALTTAAKEWAARYPFLEIVSVKEEKLAELARETGRPVELGPEDVLAASRAYYEKTFAGAPEPVNATPQEMNAGSKRAAKQQAEIDDATADIRKAVENADPEDKVSTATTVTADVVSEEGGS